jgi:hypothetical protein
MRGGPTANRRGCSGRFPGSRRQAPLPAEHGDDPHVSSTSPRPGTIGHRQMQRGRLQARGGDVPACLSGLTLRSLHSSQCRTSGRLRRPQAPPYRRPNPRAEPASPSRPMPLNKKNRCVGGDVLCPPRRPSSSCPIPLPPVLPNPDHDAPLRT